MPFEPRRFVCAGCGATENLNCWQDCCDNCGGQLMPVKHLGLDAAADRGASHAISLHDRCGARIFYTMQVAA